MPDLALDEWVAVFTRIYGRRNEARAVEELWLCAVQQVSRVAEEIRKTKYYQCYRELATTFAWFCGFFGRCQDARASARTRDDVFNIEAGLSETVALKYPDKCGHCGQGVCHCGLTRIEGEARSRKTPGYPNLFRVRLAVRGELMKAGQGSFDDRKLTGWVGMFRSIYGNQVYSLTPDAICFHLMEEVGEVADAVRLLAERARALDSPEGKTLRRIASDLWTKEPAEINDDDFEHRLMCWNRRESGESEARAAWETLASMFGLDDSTPPQEYWERQELVDLWRDQLELRYELADVFSWMCTLSIKLDDIIVGASPTASPRVEGKSRFSATIDEEYQNTAGEYVCSVCKESECAERHPSRAHRNGG